MSDQQQQKKGLQEGPPVWVESILTPEEYRQCAKQYPSCFSNGASAVAYNATYHKGGKWRGGMGSSLSAEEISISNKRLDKLFELVKETADA